ncbi:cytochrome c oxidase subunit 1 (mitochondrion) [Cafeteria roenbergensis]|nr:cytochrome c oxidase subunit 1 [Cafeteria roenbergensis]
MPRRIPDYPDAYAGWNFIASVGSYISIIAFLLFFVQTYLVFFSKPEDQAFGIEEAKKNASVEKILV